MINSNILSQIIDQILNEKRPLYIFEPPPLRAWRMEATYTVHLWLIGKLAMNFLFVLIELSSLGVTVTAEVLGRYIDWKLAFLNGTWVSSASSRIEGDIPGNHFC